MAETLVPELGKVARNGSSAHAAMQDPRPSGKRVTALKGAKTKRAITSGRQVDPLAGSRIPTVFDTEPRPFGREESTLRNLRAIRDLDPQAAQAVWNFVRLINPGHHLNAYVFDTQGNEILEEGEAQQYLNDLARRIGEDYGSGLDQLHNVLSLSLITTGAVCAEVAPNESLDDIIDWYPVDPGLITFKRIDGELQLGQKFRDNTWVPLPENQVFYVPLDPDVDDPYGRPPLLSSMSAVLAKAQMLNDLRAVAHNQGYPRIDVSVVYDKIIEAAPESLRTNPDNKPELQQWATDVLATIIADYEAMNVDDTFVHFDFVSMDTVGGSAGVGTFKFEEFEKILSRQVNSSLKTLPILLGYNEATSETHGSIQWQIQVRSVLALQRLIKRVIERLANATLQIVGFNAHAKVEYDDIRQVDRLYEAQSAFFETRAMQVHVMMGWRSNDEAAEIITGHEAVAEPQAIAISPLNGPGSRPPTGEGKQGNDEDQQTSDYRPPTQADGPQSPADWAAWQLALEDDVPRAPLFTTGGLPATSSRLTEPEANAIADGYAAQGRAIFQRAEQDCISLLEAEGFALRAPSDPIESPFGVVGATRDQARDVADHVFGLSYSRDMKALLRDAFREGMRAAGLEEPLPAIDERLIDRVWRSNRQFVTKIRDDLKEELRRSGFRTMDDIAAWFADNAYRGEMMARFLAKQGVTAGYAYGVELLARQANELAEQTFVWQSNDDARTCATCEDRDGETYTYEELVSIGFPGSVDLICKSNCRCFVEAA